MSGIDWQHLGAGVLIAEVKDGDTRGVTEQLGTDWTWDSEEYGVLTDEDGTVTEWMTLHGARRVVLTDLPDEKAA